MPGGIRTKSLAIKTDHYKPTKYKQCWEKLTSAVEHRDAVRLLQLIQNGDIITSFPCPSLSDRDRIVNPVELACSLGYANIIQLFLDHGCSPNLPTSEGRLVHTVLECTKSQKLSLAESRELVRVLCSSSCDVNLKSNFSKTTLLYAAELGDSEILKYILKLTHPSQLSRGDPGPNGYTPLQMSSMRGDLDCVLPLLKKTPLEHVNVQDRKGNTALTLALKAMQNSLRYLNSASASIGNNDNSKKQRNKLLQLQFNSIAVVEALLKAGADLKQYNEVGAILEDTPLFLAMTLFYEDQTKGFKHDPSHIKMGFNDTKSSSIISNSENKDTQRRNSLLSPYGGLVRLLLLSGARPLGEKYVWDKFFNCETSPHLKDIIDEIFSFKELQCLEIPQRLLHLTKQVIREHMVTIQKLHEIDQLPVPDRLKAYIKLQYL